MSAGQDNRPTGQAAALGTRLRDIRRARGLALREVERRTGVNSGYLSQLERGHVASPHPNTLAKIAGGYGESFAVLMQWAGYVNAEGLLNTQRVATLLGDEFTDAEVEAIRAVLTVLRGAA